ncbi:MAG: M36 family metallopeptidase, partial [Bacteroidota bacterium]
MRQKHFISAVTILLLAMPLYAQKVPTFVKEYIQKQVPKWQLSPSDIAEMRLSDRYTSKHNGITHFYFTQQHRGIDVQNALINLNVRLDAKKVLFGNSRFIADLSSKIQSHTPLLSPSEALLSTAIHLDVEDLTIGKLLEQTDKDVFIFEAANMAAQEIRVQLKYMPTNSDVHLVWVVEFDTKNTPDYWSVKVDALDGRILAQHNYTLYNHHHSHSSTATHHHQQCQFLPELLKNPHPAHRHEVVDGAIYHVFAVPLESPIHGERSRVINPADSMASPFGWHDIDGVVGAEYTITRGNNVHAYSDANAENASQGDEPDGGSDLVFDFFYEEGLEPDTFRDFATTQLFYMNNVLHDFAYAYGMTEEAGSFQVNNYGQGGRENDAIIAHAQDGSGTNNANFATPPDGRSGVMQMYTWTRSGLLTVTSPAAFAGVYETSTASFGKSILDDSLFIQADVHIAKDGFGTLACSEIQDDLTGKIALIDRGECFFSLKAYHAQEAGAVAVIICNYEGGNLVTMGAGDHDEVDLVEIPSVMMGYSDCQRLRVFAEQGLNVVLAQPEDDGPSRLDGTLDNGIIAHEYGHGISNRLTGGPSNVECLFNLEQMGEGWSDFFSLVTTVRPGSKGNDQRGIGVFVREQGINGAGIRRLPYSTSTEINSHTYDNIVGSSSPHALGEVWASVLWDLYWAMVEEYGWDEDLYHGTGGNNMAIQLVMDGMKFQACSPGFLDGRDAILAADEALYEGAHQCLIWAIFAKRGLGYDALQRSANNRNDGRTGFKTLPACLQELSFEKIVSDEIRAGDPITVTLRLTNHQSVPMTDLFVQDVFTNQSTFANFTTDAPPVASYEVLEDGITFEIDQLESGDTLEIQYQLHTSSEFFSTATFSDDIENGDEFWEFLPLGAQTGSENIDIWRISPNRGREGSAAWFVPATDNENDQALQLLDPILVEGQRPFLRFYHRYQTEWGNDGGIVRISRDGGNQWELVDDKILRNTYQNPLTYGAFAIPNIYGFTGEGLGAFRPSYIDLTDYLGEEILVQFRFGTNDETGGFGWVVDDIALI